MSNATPRQRGRHQQTSSGSHQPQAQIFQSNNLNSQTTIPLPSDYESDAAAHTDATLAAQPAIPPTASEYLLNRTNTDLNLSVLRRYVPSITVIHAIAANAVVYLFGAETQNWEKSGVEGTLFVCEQEPTLSPAAAIGGAVAVPIPRACVFILNRRGLDNVVIDLANVSVCEVADQLLIFKLDASQETAGEDKIVGLWMHASDSEDTRDENTRVIQALWQQIRGSHGHDT